MKYEIKKISKKDSATICSWIKDEKSLYQWSANRIGKFPLANSDLNENYASKITLGVFANNDNAKYCYKSVGFQPAGKTEIYKMPIGKWECIEMEFDMA